MRHQAVDYVFVGVLAITGFLYLQMIYRPAVHEMEAKSRQMQTTEAEICKSEDFTRGLDDLERYLNEFEEAIANLDRLVPSHGSGDDRVREIASVVSRCGLRANSIRPDPPVPKGEITAHPLTVKVSGSYAQVVQFLFEAEALPRHTRVTTFTMDHDLEQMGELRAEIELTSYSISDVGGGGA